MKKADVPQDTGVLDGWHEISYAIDENGRYVQVPSTGWEAANIANQEAWREIDRRVQEARKQILAGKLSPLAYHMARNQMDAALLASYIGLSRRKVIRHLKPAVFDALDSTILKRYAEIFALSIEDLRIVSVE